MTTLKQRKSKVKSFLFLISIILCISLSFLLLSCGAGPTLKTSDPEKGQFAVDFSENPPDTGPDTELGFVNLQQSINSTANIPLTIEAWVRRNSNSAVTGGVFSRTHNFAGISLYIENNLPKFALAKCANPPSPYIVDSGVSLINGDWAHIAAVLVNEDHSHAQCESYTYKNVGQHTSIDLDSSNKAHISYYNVSSGDLDLKYATNSSDLWAVSTLDSTGDVGQYTSIDLDSSNNIYISYIDATNPTNTALKYIAKTSGSWGSAQTADSGLGTEVKSTSIKIDTNGKLHISYHETNQSTKYNTNYSGSWPFPPRFIGGYSSEYTPDYTNLVLDETNTIVYVSYYNNGTAGTQGLRLTYCDYTTDSYTECPNSTWSTNKVTVDSSANVGQYSSMAIDSSGNLHFSYYDSTNGDLKYATGAPGSFTVTTVDSTGDVGQYTSISVDSNGKAHISYYDVTNTALKYATNASGSWVTTTVDNTEDIAGQYSAIAIDSNNKAHISYYTSTVNYLKYATNASGSWVAEVVDSGKTATSTSGRNETPHIDIYVDGEYKNCVSTGSNFADAMTYQFEGNCTIIKTDTTTGAIKYANEAIGIDSGAWGVGTYPIWPNTKLNAVVDDVRFWKEARTPSEIETWRHTEITFTNWNQANPDNALIGYWKFNAGAGSSIADHSGSGNSGTKNYCYYDCIETALSLPWDGGWITGYPF